MKPTMQHCATSGALLLHRGYDSRRRFVRRQGLLYLVGRTRNRVHKKLHVSELQMVRVDRMPHDVDLPIQTK